MTAAMRPGVVVRVRLGAGLSYTSKATTRAEADELGAKVAHEIKLANGGWSFVTFVDSTLGQVWIRAQKVVAIEVRDITGAPGFAPGASS